MSSKKSKSYRRTVNKIVGKGSVQTIDIYLKRLCGSSLKVRAHFLWFILLKKNPHTGKKYGKE